MIEKPGIYHDMPTADYFADPCPEPSFTQSLAKILLEQSALHARNAHPRLVAQPEEPEEYTAPKAIGNAAHLFLIGRGKEIAEARFDNWRKKEAQEFKAEASAAGKTPILSKHLQAAASMASAARVQLTVCGWDDAFVDGRGEAVLAWQEDGLWFRTMIDWLGERRAYDLKTGGGSFAPHTVAIKMEADGWDIQAAMHERALNALHPAGAGRFRFRFIAQENYPPYALVPIEMNEHWLTMGRKKLDFALGIWRRCVSTGTWEGYPSAPIIPDYPTFREARWLDREQAYADNIVTLERLAHQPTDLLMGG
jgi:hypothetical protein